MRPDPPKSVLLLGVLRLKLVAEDFDSLPCLMLCAILHLAALGYTLLFQLHLSSYSLSACRDI